MRLLRRCIDLVLTPILRNRAERMGRFISTHLSNREKVLDVGCGDLLVSQKLVESKKINLVGIDILNYNKTNLAFRYFDGKKIPFKDNSFDTVLLSFLLHHITFENQLQLIEEAKRISRKKIIILEDVYESWFGLQLTRLHDICVNKIICFDIKCPLSFRTTKEWGEIFKSKKLKLKEQHTIVSLPIKIQNQVLFHLSLK